MKIPKDTEVSMLLFVVKPKLQEARECLRAGKVEKMQLIICRDIIGLLSPYRDSEMEKYNNSPDSLKTAPKVSRMKKDAELYQEAIDLLFDEKENLLRPIDMSTLDAVEGLVNMIL